MSPSTPLKLVGAYGSPYSRKMRAVLRYRRIPFRWIRRGAPEDVGVPPVPVALIPVLVFPGAEGAPDEAMIDSTPQIRRLETLYAERGVVPRDPALAYLDALIEDYGDEWLTKAMFHYRWSYAPDIEKASRVLPLERQIGLCGESFEQAARAFAERQIGRLGVVGSNETTQPVIEESYRRLLRLLDAHLQQAPFLMGGRPGAGDFGLQGQLSQLALFDPTSVEVAEREAPRVIAWLTQLEDLSWLEPVDDDWLPRSAAADLLRPLLAEIGRVYAPFLLANAAAVERGAAQVECQIDGRTWTQAPFGYQAKCLRWLREGRSELGPADRAFVDDVLAGTGCEALLK
jgi:glutathione S-transferase